MIFEAQKKIERPFLPPPFLLLLIDPGCIKIRIRDSGYSFLFLNTDSSFDQNIRYYKSNLEKKNIFINYRCTSPYICLGFLHGIEFISEIFPKII